MLSYFTVILIGLFPMANNVEHLFMCLFVICVYSTVKCLLAIQFSSVQLSLSVMAHSLQPHGLQLTRLPCPSATSGVCSNSCPLSQWCHPTISSSVVPFSSWLQSFLASASFPMSQFFASDGQIIGVSTSASVLPMNSQDWFPLRWTSWIWLLFDPSFLFLCLSFSAFLGKADF